MSEPDTTSREFEDLLSRGYTPGEAAVLLNVDLVEVDLGTGFNPGGSPHNLTPRLRLDSPPEAA